MYWKKYLVWMLLARSKKYSPKLFLVKLNHDHNSYQNGYKLATGFNKRICVCTYSNSVFLKVKTSPTIFKSPGRWYPSWSMMPFKITKWPRFSRFLVWFGGKYISSGKIPFTISKKKMVWSSLYYASRKYTLREIKVFLQIIFFCFKNKVFMPHKTVKFPHRSHLRPYFGNWNLSLVLIFTVFSFSCAL